MVHASIIIASNCVETDIRFVLIVLNVQTFAEIFKKNITEIKFNHKKNTPLVSPIPIHRMIWMCQCDEDVSVNYLSFSLILVFSLAGYIEDWDISKICVFLNTWTFELHVWWIWPMCYYNCPVWWTQFIYMRFAYRRILSLIPCSLSSIVCSSILEKKIRWGKNSVIYNFEIYGLVVLRKHVKDNFLS